MQKVTHCSRQHISPARESHQRLKYTGYLWLRIIFIGRIYSLLTHGNEFLSRSRVNGDTVIKVPFGGAHLHRHAKPL